MMFTAPSFLFLFLPLMLSIYVLVPQFYRRYVILLANLIFYVIACWSTPITIAIAFFSAALTYSFGYAIAVTHRRSTLFVAVALHLSAFLAYRFIYTYTAEIASPYFPLGASFYLLASLSYLFDIYRNDAPHAKNIGDLLSYMLFFPTLIVGPIIRYKDFDGMMARITLSVGHFSEGIKLYIAGFLKRISIAAVLNFMLDQMLDIYGGKLSIGLALIGLCMNFVQLWFSLSGYSDMARGIMYMLGIPHANDFPLPNSLHGGTDYLRRFFISLNRWIEDYLVYPILRQNLLSARTRRILAACVLSVVPALWIKTEWYMLLPVFPVLIYRILRILREPHRRANPSRIPRFVRRFGGIASSILIFLLFWLFVSLDRPMDALIYGKELLQNALEPIPYGMYAVFSHMRYLIVGAVGLAFLLPLHTRADAFFGKIPRAVSALIRGISLVIVMACFCFSIIHFLPQFPNAAVNAFERIVL